MSERLIDLGVPGDGTDLLEADAWHPRPAGNRWPLAAGMLVLVAVFTAGSLPAPQIEQVAEVPDRVLGFNADDDNVYGLRADPTITAYSWREGTARWSRSIAAGEGQLYVAGGRPYVRFRPCTRSASWTLESIDPGTGKARWDLPGGPIATMSVGGARHLLVVDEPQANCPPVTTRVPGTSTVLGPPVRLSAVNADDGKVRWNFPLDNGRLVVPEELRSWFAIWYASGRAEVHDTATGATLAGAVLPELTDSPPTAVRVVGELLLIANAGLEGTELTAYRRSDLSLAWHQLFPFQQPAPLVEMAYGPTVLACGPAICVVTLRDVSMLDPATGETRWRAAGQLDEAGSGVALLRLRTSDAHIRIVRWDSGAVAADLPGWAPVSLVGSPPPDLALVQRSDSGDARLAVVDLRTGQLIALGTVTEAPIRCAVVERRLACLVAGDLVHVWRLPV